MNYQQLLQQVQDYVITYYKTHNTGTLIYHDTQHTNDVVTAATQIANHYQLNDSDFFIVMCACWFHDIGYIDAPHSHEQKGAEQAAGFLKANNVDEGLIASVQGCIMATKMPQSASTLLEQIVCDADLYHLGTEAFVDKDNLMRKEYNVFNNADMSKLEWRKKSIAFLQQHQYYTEYCKLLLNDTQAKNLADLQGKVSKKESREEKGKIEVAETSNADLEIKGKKKKTQRPEKGIETMFRVSSSNHQRLSDMADQKAHILITVNSIILSAIISLILRKISEYEFLIVPTVILLTISVLAMTFSILSTRPTIPMGYFSKEDVDNKSVNLLFFGNFYKMKLDDYYYGMHAMMEDRDFLYDSLIRDLYAQGVVLGRKYRLLRIAYNIFMFGLIVSMIAFVIASAFFNHAPAK